MSEFLSSYPPSMLIGILAKIIGLWALIKAFRTRSMVKALNKRLTEHRRMISQAGRIASAGYNKAGIVEEALQVIAETSVEYHDQKNDAHASEPTDSDDMEDDSHERDTDIIEEGRYVTEPINQQEERPRP